MKKTSVKFLFLFCLLIYLYPIYTYFNIITILDNFVFYLKDEDKITKLSEHALIGPILFLNQQQNNKKILTIRQAELVVYSQKEIVHIYDKRISRIVKAGSKKQVMDLLKEMNIGYIMTYYYDDPVYYATFIKDILCDHLVSTIVYNNQGVCLYKIENKSVSSIAIPSPSNKNFVLKVSHMSTETNGTYWLSHVDADLYPYLPPNKCLKELGDDSGGIYTYNLIFEIEVLKDLLLSLKKINYYKFDINSPLKCPSDSIQDFYLKKGSHKIRVRFLNDKGSFRLLFFSKEKNAFIVKNAIMDQTLSTSAFKIKTKDGEIPLFKNQRYVPAKANIMFENVPGEFFNKNYFVPLGGKMKLDLEGEGLFCVCKNNPFNIKYLVSNPMYFDCFGLTPERKTLTIYFEKKAALKFILRRSNEKVKKCWIKIYNAELN